MVGTGAAILSSSAVMAIGIVQTEGMKLTVQCAKKKSFLALGTASAILVLTDAITKTTVPMALMKRIASFASLGTFTARITAVSLRVGFVTPKMIVVMEVMRRIAR